MADRLHSLAIHLLRQLRRQDDAAGLSAPRLSALSVIVFGGPIALGALARAEQVKAPTMSRLVDALEKDGLVRRRDDPGDARGVQLEATAKGRRLLTDGRARRVAVLASALERLPNTERTLVADCLDVLGRVVTDVGSELDAQQRR